MKLFVLWYLPAHYNSYAARNPPPNIRLQYPVTCCHVTYFEILGRPSHDFRKDAAIVGLHAVRIMNSNTVLTFGSKTWLWSRDRFLFITLSSPLRLP